MSLAAYMAADLLYFHSTHELSRSDLVVVAGTVERTVYIPEDQIPKSRHGTREPIVDVWLAGREHPFRFFGRQWHSLAELPPGAPLSLGLDPDVMQSPLKPTFLRPDPRYLPMTVLTKGSWWDVRLNHHNEFARSYLALMPWLTPLVAMLGFLLSTRRCADWMEAQPRNRYGLTRKPFKDRLSLRLLK